MERTVKLGNAVHRVKIIEFEDDIDIDSLLRIDASNIIGEVVNFPVIVNRFGLMVAQANKRVAEIKLDIEVHTATLKKELLAKHEAEGLKAPTAEAMGVHVSLDPKHRALKKLFIQATEDQQILESVMWSAKDKSDKLNKLSLSTLSGDVDEALRGEINVSRKGLIK